MSGADIIYAMLKQKGWTQARLNEAMGYTSPGTMSNRLRRGSMSVKVFSDIVDVLGFQIHIHPIAEPGKTVNIAQFCETELNVKTLFDVMDILGYKMTFSPELEIN